MTLPEVALPRHVIKNVHGDNDSLPFSKYSDWFDAIRCDDVTAAAAIIEEANPSEKLRLLNGVFTYRNLGCLPVKQRRKDLTRPLLMTATFGSLGVLGLMLEQGADPEVTEEGEMNILHALVAVMSYNKPGQCQRMTAVYRYLVQSLKPEVLKRLLLGESTLGLRPVEFAAQQGCFLLMLEIFNTDDIYVIQRENVGVTQYVWSDITEYESEAPAGRRRLSMLNFIENMDYEILGCVGTMGMLSRGLISAWLESRARAYRPFFYVWAIIRMIHIAGFFIIDVDTSKMEAFGGVSHLSSEWERGNASFVYCEGYSSLDLHPHVRHLVEIAMIILSTTSLIITTVLKISHMRRNRGLDLDNLLSGKRSVLKQSAIYDGSHILYCLLTLLYCSISITNWRINMAVVDVLRVVLIFSAIFSFFFFVQLAPGIGHYIITLNRMMVDLLRFTLVFLFIQIPFVLILTNIMNTHGSQCFADFSSLVEAFFTIFRLMLNLVDVTQYDIIYKYVLYVIHMQYVFIISVLLINFLIAVMAHSVDVVNDNKPIIMNIQKIWVSSQIQDFLLFFCPGIHARLIRKVFCTVGNKVCVVYGRCNQ